MKSKKIVLCEVVEINNNYIKISYSGKVYRCFSNNISDYPVDLFKYFRVGNKYKFLLKDGLTFSYKDIRPKLLKNKKKPTPTISGVKNLEKHLLEIIKNLE